MSEAAHIPVMLPEVLEALGVHKGQHIVDGTFGAGGYTSAILDAGAKVTAIDRDPTAIKNGQQIVVARNGELHLAQGRFSDMQTIASNSPHGAVDGVVLDIGVSSMQIDQAARGFSFQKNGPLDMRMEAEGLSAADVVNNMPRTDLTRLIGIWGEEKKASQVSRAIDARRSEHFFETTEDLARVIEKAVGHNPKSRIHPATRTFQALRIYVNRELHQLCEALFAAERLLQEGGRLVVVTFHSLEDRIVKRFFADRSGASQSSRFMPQVVDVPASFEPLVKGAMAASQSEADINPRARSAKLRAGRRTGSDVPVQDISIFGLPNLPDHSQIKLR